MKRLAIGLLTTLILVICGCEEEPEAVETSFFAMNTHITFTAYGENAQEALDEAEALIHELESLWAVTNEGSDIYEANNSNGEAVTVSEQTANLVSFVLDMAKSTSGALDPTIYPVLTAWGFTTDSKQVPSSERIEELLQSVDYSRIQLDDRSLTVPEDMELDLGAVGKGYAADLVAEVLREYQVESAVLNLGGNVHTVGSKTDGNDWRIGIRAPWEEENIGVLTVSDSAVVTSGGYENYFEDDDGTIYWHIIDPSTGHPAQSDLLSVTIIGTHGRLCDALSTALFVMGLERAEDYWRENGGFDMVLVTDEKEVLITKGIADRFTLYDDREETLRVLNS